MAGIKLVEDCSVEANHKVYHLSYRFCLPAESSEHSVVLLHGARFTSEDWEKIGTLQKLQSWGYNAYALNLKYHTETRDVEDPGECASLLAAFLRKLSISAPVIVSPSMSGMFSLPYITGIGTGESKANERVKGFIPIAPVQTGKYRDAMTTINVPTLVVYGSNDEQMGFSSARNLRLIPRHNEAVIEGAGHACYLDKPDKWHEILKD